VREDLGYCPGGVFHPLRMTVHIFAGLLGFDDYQLPDSSGLLKYFLWQAALLVVWRLLGELDRRDARFLSHQPIDTIVPTKPFHN
jgi:hypothetical protein